MTTFHIIPAKGGNPVATMATLEEAKAYVDARELTVPGLTVREVKVSSRQVYPSLVRLASVQGIAAISSKGGM